MDRVENFNGLKPVVARDEGVKSLDALYKQATLNLEALAELIFFYRSSTPLRIAFILQLQGGWVFYNEIIQIAKLVLIPDSTIERNLKRLVDDGFVEKDGSRYRLTLKYRGNV